MIPLNLHHLYYFWRVAQEGSIAKACHTLYLTQPAISAQIIQLEKSLGKKLFERRKQRLHLTQEGAMVVDYANEIFNTSQELLDALRDRPTPKRLTVQVGSVDQVSKQIVQQLIKEILRFHPESQITVMEGAFESMLSELHTHRVDIVLSDRDVPVKEAGVYFKSEAGHLPTLFVAAPSLARRIKHFPRDLSKVPLILPAPASPLRSDVERFLNRHQIKPQIMAEIQDVELVRLMVLDGQGVALINLMSVSADLKSGRLKRLCRSSTGIRDTLWLITRKRHQANPIAEHLLRNFKLTQSRSEDA